MNNLLKQRLLLSATGRHLMREPKKFNFIGLKNGRASYSDSLCPPPSKDPPSPCAPQRDPPPCPPPPPPCGPPCPPPPYTAPNPCDYAKSAEDDGVDYAEIKRAQCAFQQEKGVPTYLKGGKFYVYFFQGATLLGCFTFIYSMYDIYRLSQKFP